MYWYRWQIKWDYKKKVIAISEIYSVLIFSWYLRTRSLNHWLKGIEEKCGLGIFGKAWYYAHPLKKSYR
jgi:hypothetical protein